MPSEDAGRPAHVLPIRALRPLTGDAAVLAHGDPAFVAAGLAALDLVLDEVACVWLLEQTESDGHVQIGLLGAVPLDAAVLPHEDVEPARVAHRLATLQVTGTEVEPVLLVTHSGGRLASLLPSRAPDIEHVADGVLHRLWRLADVPDIGGRAFIADGHHRWAAALAHDPHGSALAVLVDADAYGPHVHALHRVLPGVDLEHVLEAAARAFPVHSVWGVPDEDHLADLTITNGRTIIRLGPPDPRQLALALGADTGRSQAWRSLDVTVAHRLLVAHLLGLPDQPGTVEVHRTVEAAVAAARESRGTAILVPPTPLAAVEAVAVAGDRMPWKSTWFTPKPPAGLVMRRV